MSTGEHGPQDAVPSDDPVRLAAIAAASDAFSDAVPDMEALLAIVAAHIPRADGERASCVWGAAKGTRSQTQAANRAGRAIAVAQRMRDQQMTASELEIKVAERTTEVSATNHFLDSVIENIPNMIFVKDAKDLRFIRFNRAGEELLGFSRHELIGKNDFDFFPADQAEQFISADGETLRGGHLVDIPEETIQTKLKGTRTLHTKKIPILDAAGKPAFLLGISEDITEAKLAQQALRQAQGEAEQANRAKSQFLASMSHELRTPLNAILGFSELLSDDATHRFDEATRHRFLDQIHSSGAHLLQLINDILDLSKVEAGQMELHPQQVELGQLIDEVRASVEPLARSKSIALNAAPV